MTTIRDQGAMTDLPALTNAENNVLTIQHLAKDIYYNFLELGGLLSENQDYGYWSSCGYESFRDFVEMLGLGSYSWVTRLIDLSRLVASQLLTQEEVCEIGVSKACLLLPCAKKGKLDDETKGLARDCTFTDLRIHLGHHIPNSEDGDEYLLCPRCGVDITLRPGMVKRR